MIFIFVFLLTGWCRMRMRPARLVSYAFLYTTDETWTISMPKLKTINVSIVLSDDFSDFHQFLLMARL